MKLRISLAVFGLSLVFLVTGSANAAIENSNNFELPSERLSVAVEKLARVMNQGSVEEITGEVIAVIADDFESGISKNFYKLNDTARNRVLDINFIGPKPENLSHGAAVNARGRVFGNVLNVSMAGGDGDEFVVVEPADTVTMGEQKTAVLVGNFSDKSISCSVSDVDSIMFSDPADQSVDDFYQEVSHGNVSVAGDTFGTFNIDYPSNGSCDYLAWANALEAEAIASGVDLSLYPRKFYVLPSNTACSGWAGLGTVGAPQDSQTWIFRCSMDDVYAHELGHNLYMGHASTPSSTYGDYSDVMGISGRPYRELNAPHMDQMGWTPESEIVDITQSGQYEVTALELVPNELDGTPQIIRIQKPDTNDYYYLSYRIPEGFDVTLPTTYTYKLSVHRYKGDDSHGPTYLLDVLTYGETYTDDVNDITVDFVSEDGNSAIFNVTFGPVVSECIPGSPAVSVTPSEASAYAGDTLDYSIQVINTDSVDCASTQINLDGQVPLNWQGVFGSSSLTLAPGAFGDTTYSVTPDTQAIAGGYGITVDALRENDPVYSSTDSATYTVLLPPEEDTTPPTVPTNLNASVKRKFIALDWSPSVDNSGVDFYSIYRDSVLLDQVVDITYQDRTYVDGEVYLYEISATDIFGNESSLSNPLTVDTNSSGGGSGGGGGKPDKGGGGGSGGGGNDKCSPWPSCRN